MKRVYYFHISVLLFIYVFKMIGIPNFYLSDRNLERALLYLIEFKQLEEKKIASRIQYLFQYFTDIF